MKLLSIKDDKQKKDTQQALQKIRAQEIGEELDNKRSSLNQINDTFDETLKNQQQVWAEEKEAHAQWRNQAQIEVSQLENKRFLALLPVEKERENLNNERQEFEVTKTVFETEKETFEQSTLALKARLDEVSEREIQVSNQEKSVLVRQRGVELQAASVIHQSNTLSQQLEKFLQDTKDKQFQLSELENVLAAKSDTVEIHKRRLEAWEIELNRRERLLQSNYAALAAAKTEAANQIT